MQDSQTQEMLQTNTRQRAYYEATNGKDTSAINGWFTNSWRRFRERCLNVYPQEHREAIMMEKHKQWLGDLSNARVLELGVGSGSPMSCWLAKHARQYTAIDLSTRRLEELRAKLSAEGIHDAELLAVDFLSEDFDGGGYDVIYARAVLHHFRYIEPLLETLDRRLADGGMVLSYDPLQTWLPARIFRACYRPFQTDADWEFPFTGASLTAIEKTFDIEQAFGFFGRSKWALPLALVTPNKLAGSVARSLHESDRQRCTTLKRVRGCLQASFQLRKRNKSNLAAAA